MNIIDIPTEQTTAATDFILFVISLWAIFVIRKSAGEQSKLKARIWIWVFILLAIAALFGALAHGFQMSEKTNLLLWQPLNLSLGLSVSLFAAAALVDMNKGKLPKAVIPGLMALGFIFYFITVFIPGSFLIFIIFEAVVMLFALVTYIFLAVKKILKGAWWMVGGILITIVAAVIQAMGTTRVEFIWQFDHNGIFHIVQMAGIFVLLKGLTIDFNAKSQR